MSTATLPVPATGSARAPRRLRRPRTKVWNIMVYMAGDNNLAEEMVWALTSMFEAAVQELLKSIAVSVVYDSGGPPAHFTLQPVSPNEPLDLERLGERKGWNLPIKQQLKNLITTSVLENPGTPNRMLILSGHGSGAVGDFLKGNKSRLSVPDLRDILEETRRALGRSIPKDQKLVTVLGLDSCLMSMAEVAYELRDYVQYVIGSEGFEPNTGWPYKELLRRFAERTKDVGIPNPEDLVKYTVEDYIDFYTPYALADLSTDLSGLNLDNIDNLVGPLTFLAEALRTGILRDEVLQKIVLFAHWKAQGYKDEQYVDLLDFCNCLREQLTEKQYADLAKHCDDVRKALSTSGGPNDVVVAHEYCGSAFQYSNGVSVFFPWADLKDARGRSDLRRYKNLRFAQATGWHSFLREYLRKTRRQPNNPQGQPNSEKRRSHLDRRLGSTSHSGKYNPDVGSKYNPDVGSKSSVSGRIASMKNPPVDWYLRK
jgi:hypothetical protein